MTNVTTSTGIFSSGWCCSDPPPFHPGQAEAACRMMLLNRNVDMSRGSLTSNSTNRQRGEKEKNTLGKITRTFLDCAYDCTESPTKLTTMPLESLTN